MASADFSLRRSFLRRPPFKDEARSPQVRMVVFPAQPPDLRRSPLVARVRGQLSASPGSRRLVSGFCSSARGFCSPLLSAPASRPDRFPGFFALRFARGSCDQLPPGLSPGHHLHAGHTTKPLRGSGRAGVARRDTIRRPETGRLLLHVRAGKGEKHRYVMLSARWLATLPAARSALGARVAGPVRVARVGATAGVRAGAGGSGVRATRRDSRAGTPRSPGCGPRAAHDERPAATWRAG